MLNLRPSWPADMVETEAATTSTQPIQSPISLSLSISEVWDLKVWCFGITHAVILRGTGRVTFVPGILFTLLWAQTTLHCIKQHWIQISILPWCHLNDWGWRAQACKDKYIPHVGAIVIKEWWTHWNQQGCDMLGSGGPGSSDKEWGKGRCPCICTDPGWGCTAGEQAESSRYCRFPLTLLRLMSRWVKPSHLIKHLKELGTGLMDSADDCPSTLSQRLHQRNDLETGCAVQTAEEQQERGACFYWRLLLGSHKQLL